MRVKGLGFRVYGLGFRANSAQLRSKPEASYKTRVWGLRNKPSIYCAQLGIEMNGLRGQLHA